MSIFLRMFLVDNEVIIFTGQVARAGFVYLQWTVRDGKVVGVEVLFALISSVGMGDPVIKVRNRCLVSRNKSRMIL